MLKWMRLEKIQKQTPLKLDLLVLEKSVSSFRIELNNILDASEEEEPTIEKMNKILRESMDSVQNETQKSIIKKSTEGAELGKLR